VIDSEGNVFDTAPSRPDTKLGNIEDVRDLFSEQTFTPIGDQSTLNEILFGEGESF